MAQPLQSSPGSLIGSASQCSQWGSEHPLWQLSYLGKQEQSALVLQEEITMVINSRDALSSPVNSFIRLSSSSVDIYSSRATVSEHSHFKLTGIGLGYFLHVAKDVCQ